MTDNTKAWTTVATSNAVFRQPTSAHVYVAANVTGQTPPPARLLLDGGVHVEWDAITPNTWTTEYLCGVNAGAKTAALQLYIDKSPQGRLDFLDAFDGASVTFNFEGQQVKFDSSIETAMRAAALEDLRHGDQP